MTSGGVAEARPYVGDFVEEADEQVVDAQLGFALLTQVHVDTSVYALEVSHHRAHHTTRQTAAYEERRGQHVGGVDEVAEEVIDELLREGASLHVGVHVDVGDLVASVDEHLADGDDVWVDLTPREGLHSYVDDVSAVVTDLEHRGYGEARARVTVVLDDDLGVLGLDSLYQTAEEARTADTCHVLEADLGGAAAMNWSARSA